MSTREARTRATAAWRERTGLKLIQAYLHVDTVTRLDELVAERGAPGRGALLATLINAAHEAVARPGMPVAEPPAVLTPTTTAKPYKLTASARPDWRWDVVVGGAVVGRMRQTADGWAGEFSDLTGGRIGRRTRSQLAAAMVLLAN